jgi:hypothetical protein
VIQLIGDRQEAPIQALELAADFLVKEAAAVHLQNVVLAVKGSLRRAQ